VKALERCAWAAAELAPTGEMTQLSIYQATANRTDMTSKGVEGAYSGVFLLTSFNQAPQYCLDQLHLGAFDHTTSCAHAAADPALPSHSTQR
jgi:hypothetical protein